MGTEKFPRRPGWARGVQLVRVARDALHVVGDIENPVALTRASEGLLDWLVEIDGEASWNAQLADAVFRSLSLDEATAVLKRLCRAGLVVDVTTVPADPLLALTLVGSAAFTGPLRALGVADDRLLPVVAGACRADWIEAVDTAIDQSELVVLALQGVTAHASEVDAARTLRSAGREYLVLGAGPNTARVGPLVRTSMGSCLNCEELVRADLDPVWGAVCAIQATTTELPAADPVLVALAAAEGMRQLQASVSGPTDCDAATLHVGHRGAPWWRRELPPHPRCPCWHAAVA